MDEKKILIMNLSKGRVGEVNATLLGSMLVTKIYLAAMSRADVPAEQMQKLPNFYFYVDEFQNFANESFSDILSEARKYKLNLIIAHQYVEQMEEEVRDAVFGNVGTTVAFRVGPFDAETLETIFAPQFEATDLVNLGFAQIYLTLMIDGVGSPPFSATTMAPFDPPPSRHVDEVLAASRTAYGKSRVEVEKVIDEWQKVDAPEPPKPKKPATTYAKPPVAPPVVPVSVPPVVTPMVKKEEEPMPPPQPQHIRPVPPHAVPKPYVPPVAPKPPLEGPKSLKEALAHITHAPKPVAPSSPLTEVLRDMLKVDPAAEAPPRNGAGEPDATH